MKSQYGLICFLVVMVFSFGCATAPKNYNFNPVCSFDCEFDEVWAGIIEYFAITNMPIQTIEKDSGIIVTSWMNASTGTGSEDKTICDCGGSGLSIPRWTRGKFNVFCTKNNSNGVDIRVTCNFQQERELLDSRITVDCVSTGYLENNIHEYIMSKISNRPQPEIPTFSPGQGG